VALSGRNKFRARSLLHGRHGGLRQTRFKSDLKVPKSMGSERFPNPRAQELQ